MKRAVVWAAAGIAALLAVLQFFPAERTNPPVEWDAAPDGRVRRSRARRDGRHRVLFVQGSENGERDGRGDSPRSIREQEVNSVPPRAHD